MLRVFKRRHSLVIIHLHVCRIKHAISPTEWYSVYKCMIFLLSAARTLCYGRPYDQPKTRGVSLFEPNMTTLTMDDV